MDISIINWWAVLAAAISTFVLGGLWYSNLLFGKAWAKENNFTDADLAASNKARIFGFAFIWAVVMAFNLAMLLNSTLEDYSYATKAAFMISFGGISSSIFTIGLFEQKSTRYMLINAGYTIVSYIIMAFIISVWS